MKLLLVAVGRVRGNLGPAATEYEERASRYWKLETVEVDAGLSGRGPGRDRILAAEAERIRGALPASIEYWTLTRGGHPLDSTDWARALGDRALHGGRDLALIIGGAHGLDPGLVRDGTRAISLASVTLPHELARVVLVEQLYRAGTILRNEPYHKGR